ncbi:MAG TPA: pitrilysin family protein [Bacteroidia bacterium]|jgi:predicted Zn-dependent peptidase|nr:pitrilysin family protein [Bacteroidia bacterium]
MKKYSLIILLPVLAIFFGSAGTGSSVFPQEETYKLDNGMQVIFADYGELPVTSFTFFINVGKKSETPGQQGMADLTANALTMGCDGYDRAAMDRALYKMGTDISCAANENYTTLSGEFLNENCADGVQLLAATLIHPTFPVADIDQTKGFTLTQNKPSKMDIGDLADEFGNLFTYGSAHPLGRHFYETQYSKVGVDQLKRFYEFNYTPGNTILLVTGKPDRQAVKVLLEKYFSSWKAAMGEINGSVYDIPAIKSKEYAFIPKDGATQACLEWFKRAPDAGSKDMIAFRLANMVFSDRLMKDIREKDGYTYGIYSRYSEAMNDGIFRAKTQVRNEVMYSTILAFDSVLTNFNMKGATDAELKKFKNMMKTDVLNIEEPSTFASVINPLVYKDYNKRMLYLSEVDAIDLVTLNKVIKKYFTSDCYKLMIAGDAVALSPQLNNLSGLQKMMLTDIEKDQ